MAFSPDGTKIVSRSDDEEIKVWDATPRLFNAAEWEEVDISGMKKNSDGEVQIDGLGNGYIKSNYWKNTVTGDLRKEYSTLGELLALEPIQFWDGSVFWAPNSPSIAETDHSCLPSQPHWSSRPRRPRPTELTDPHPHPHPVCSHEGG